MGIGDDMMAPLRKVRAGGDAVEHPPHYNKVPGIECIEVVKWFNYNIGAAMKYLWRHEHKGFPIEDLRKAQQYIQFEIERLEVIREAERLETLQGAAEAMQTLQEYQPED